MDLRPRWQGSLGGGVLVGEDYLIQKGGELGDRRRRGDWEPLAQQADAIAAARRADRELRIRGLQPLYCSCLRQHECARIANQFLARNGREAVEPRNLPARTEHGHHSTLVRVLEVLHQQLQAADQIVIPLEEELQVCVGKDLEREWDVKRSGGGNRSDVLFRRLRTPEERGRRCCSIVWKGEISLRSLTAVAERPLAARL